MFAPTAADADPRIGDAGVTIIAAAAGVGAFESANVAVVASMAYSFCSNVTSAEGTSYTAVQTFITGTSTPLIFEGGFE